MSNQEIVMLPSTYVKKDVEEILEKIAEGRGLKSVVKDDPRYPPESTFRTWVKDNVDGLAERYHFARLLAADALADEILQIADDSSNDYKQLSDGTLVLDNEAVARSRVRIDARKWLARCIAPKTYGDRVEQNHTGGLHVEHTVQSLLDKVAKQGGRIGRE